ncbi:MAG: TetR/AcrR family transcriptional regulator [Sporichthyaceae bacterium]
MAKGVRERMVGSGAELFAERGLNVTMLEVVEHAEAPRGSIYHHFPAGKPELAVAVAQQTAVEIEAMVAHFATKIAEPEPFLHRLVDHHCRRLTTSDYKAGCPLMGMVAAGEHVPEIDVAVEESFTAWVRTIADALTAKQVAPAAAQTLAGALVVGVEGAIAVARAQRSPAPFEALKGMLGILLAAS